VARDDGVDVVVEMLRGCGVVVEASVVVDGDWMRVVVVVVVEGGWVADEARIQHLTPRLRPRAPSTPAELVIPGFVMN
jgi:hypothetical protein